MENLIVKTRKRREVRNSDPREIKRIISEEDIRRRAYEIYLENRDTQFDDLDNWLCAERELKGSE
jgi:Protein of unknown function (DUF2934)